MTKPLAQDRHTKLMEVMGLADLQDLVDLAKTTIPSSLEESGTGATSGSVELRRLHAT